jgi:very-short-patch-repair endonuclease
MTPRDFTPQEQIVAELLDEFGLRYEQQVLIDNYTADFVVEGSIVIEADGIFGHLKKRDRKRDKDILESRDMEIVSVFHIKKQTKEKIKQELIQCLELPA